jgi:hypothetical protein
VTKDAVALVTKEDWEGFCRHTETVESQYWKRDGILPDVIDRIVINLSPGSDSYSDGKNSDTDSQVTVTTVKLPVSTIILRLMKTLT